MKSDSTSKASQSHKHYSSNDFVDEKYAVKQYIVKWIRPKSPPPLVKLTRPWTTTTLLSGTHFQHFRVSFIFFLHLDQWISLTPPLLLKCLHQVKKVSGRCVTRFDFSSVYTILGLYFVTIPTLWYILELFTTVWYILELFSIAWYILELLSTVWYIMELFPTVWYILEL